MSEVKDISSGIQITVENCLAFKARPFTILESQIVIDPATLKASLTRREKPIEFVEPRSAPPRLVGEMSDEFAPTRIVDTFSKPMICAHPFNVQALRAYLLVLADKPGTLLVKKILSSIRYLFMLNGKKPNSLRSISAAFFLARYASLKPFQSSLCRSQVTGRFNTFSIGDYGESFQAKVYANLSAYFLRLHGLFNLAQNRGKIFAGLCSRNCDALCLPLGGPMIYDLYGSKFRYLDRPVRYHKMLRHGERLPVSLRLEFRKVRPLVEKVIVGNVKMLQRGLERLGVGIIKPLGPWFCFKSSEHFSRIEEIKRLLLLSFVRHVEIDPLTKEVIENKARGSKLIEQGVLLLFRWIESEAERPVESHVYYYSRHFVKSQRRTPYVPTLESGGFRAKET